MHTPHRNRRWLLALVLLLPAGVPAGASDWPRFRGPNGTGISADKDVPVKWTAEQGVRWKTVIPGVGHSSPIVSGGKVFLQSASSDGKARWLLCLDAASGEILWKATAPGRAAHTHPFNTLASSTPAADGQNVYALFWDGRDIHLCAYDFKGNPVWKKNLGGFESQHGVGHSPTLVDGKVIVANDQDGSAHLLAFEAASGKKLWQVERKAYRSCYSTPFVHQKAGGEKELIVASTAGISGYNPSDGAENWSYTWSFAGMPLRTVASPILAGDLVIASSGDGRGDRHLIAVKLGGKGDVTRTNLAWENRKAFPYVPCLLSRGEHLYGVTDKGLAICYVAATGEEVWSERLGKGFTASPILVDGKVYAAANDGVVHVFEASTKFKKLAGNPLGEPVSSTPAVADNCLFIRGSEHLFCIGKSAVRPAAPGRRFNRAFYPAGAERIDKGEKKVDNRVFELRTYTAAPGKLDALNARFRDHTNKLFKKHGITIIGFWMPLDQKPGEEKLIYILAYPSKEAADKSWQAFRDDPEWKAVVKESEKDGRLLAKRPESVFLKPTDYSPLK